MEDKRSIPTAGNACAEWHVHDDRLAQADAHMPDEDTLYDLAELYKMFGDSTRIKILYALVDTELCVCDIAQVLTMSVSAISHQLRVLKQARLVKYRREGKTVFYSLADDHVHEILALGLEHINE
ncbi:MAG: helix-turn-helix transcriptional regulator [Clostridia bacterium]|nr:helix-turn-helix transcriptional regulator [Clostridia bacterium]